jgi:hypothetical protein
MKRQLINMLQKIRIFINFVQIPDVNNFMIIKNRVISHARVV